MTIQLENHPICLICGREGKPLYSQLADRLFSVEGKWNLLICTECGLIWLNPRPIKDEIGKLYVNYHTHEAKVPPRHVDSLKKSIRNSILKAAFGYPVQSGKFNWFGRLLSSVSLIRDTVGAQIMMLDSKLRGKLLDVGAGNGAFLKNMRDLGWEAIGIDPDLDAARLAKDVYSISILPQTLDDTTLSDDCFDVITMDHVTEHLPDPLESLQKIHDLLKPGGLLVIMTPNVASLGHRTFKKAWLHLDPPRHFYLFNLYSLNALVKKANFSIINSRTVSSSAWWVWITCKVIKTHGRIEDGKLNPNDLRFTMKIRGGIFSIIEELQRLKILPGDPDSGEELYLMARKI